MFNFSMSPPQASNFAGYHDTVFYILTALTVIFTLGVAIAVLFLAVRYRAGNKVDRSNPPHESHILEITWSVIPLILGLVVFFISTKLFIDMRTPPKGAMEIYVVGKQWMWHIQHQNGIRENNTLHVPVGKPVKLTMISQDVIHAFYIPAFRIQYHVVPGRYTQQWFTATKPGVYYLFCAMYCGNQHSEMGGYVYAMDPKDFARWQASGGESAAQLSPEQEGAKLWNQLGCGNGNCHVGGDTERGPTLAGILGKTRKFTDGSSAVADEAYIRESILQPYNRITVGYGNEMPAYEGQVSEQQILNLLAYIKTIGGGAAVAPKSSSMETNGGVTGNPYVKPNTNLAVGAIGAQREQRPGPRSGNLSAGAISTQGREGGQP